MVGCYSHRLLGLRRVGIDGAVICARVHTLGNAFLPLFIVSVLVRIAQCRRVSWVIIGSNR
jgi:hypothetical protein